VNIDDLTDFPLARIKVRGLVRCGDEYLFIQRCHHGQTKKFLVFPGGRLKKSDRIKGDKRNLGATLKSALVRELQEELAAREIVVGDFLSVSKLRKHDREVLFHVDVASFDWNKRTGKEFDNPNKGTYELVTLKTLDKASLGKKGLHLKPKEWRKLLYRLNLD
jgi:8-oxo-dGTP pyrophosphatase MutT (NUDIX family)